MRFECKNCTLIFEGEGRKEDYQSPIYGPCSKQLATCPQCGMECTEYRSPKPSRKSSAPAAPACGMGGCCCHR